MLIIFSAWHLLVGGMYQGANEHFVLKVDALEEGKMGKRENVSFKRVNLWWLDDWVRPSAKMELLWAVPSLLWSVSIKSVPMKEML